MLACTAHQTPCDPFLIRETLPAGDLLTRLLTRSQNQERLILYALAGADRLLKSIAKKWTTRMEMTAPMKEVISGMCVLGTRTS